MDKCPKADRPEYAFIGRSNVGKSSLLNRVTGQPRLAYSSSTPGRTQSVNFFQVEDRLMLVDLPGYGFAKAPREISRAWQAVIDAYLLERKSLRLCILLLDARRGWMESDLQLKNWLEYHRRPFLVVATKADKLNQKEKSASQKSFRVQYPEGDLVWFSALNGQGVKEIWQTIWKTTAA